MSAAHKAATPGGFNMLVNLLNAYTVWDGLTKAQRAALTAWPAIPSKRVAENLRAKGLLDEDGLLTRAGMFVCWAKFTDRKHEFEPEGGWLAPAEAAR